MAVTAVLHGFKDALMSELGGHQPSGRNLDTDYCFGFGYDGTVQDSTIHEFVTGFFQARGRKINLDARYLLGSLFVGEERYAICITHAHFAQKIMVQIEPI